MQGLTPPACIMSSLSGLVKNEIPTSPYSLNPTPYSLNSKP